MSFDEWYKEYSVGADFEPESATAEWADYDLKEAYEAGRQSQLGSFISVKLAAENEKVAREQGRQAGLEEAAVIDVKDDPARFPKKYRLGHSCGIAAMREAIKEKIR